MKHIRLNLFSQKPCKLQVRNTDQTMLNPRGSRKRMATAIFAMASAACLSPTFAWGDESSSDIDQTGAHNTAEIEQQNAEFGLHGYINQTGSSNDAYIFQVGPVEEEIVSEIWQTGSSNSAVTEQSDITRSATLSIQQTGHGNSTTAAQVGSELAQGVVEQVGSYNEASLYQGQPDTTAVITQYGTANSANVDQSGEPFFYFQEAFVYQEGDDNAINVLQDQMGMNRLDSQQVGTGNYAEIHQFQDADMSEGVATAILRTDGNYNQTYVEQDTNALGTFTLEQSGDFNFVSVFQAGEGADATIVSHDSHYNSDSVQQEGLEIEVEVDRISTDNSTTDLTQRTFDSNIYVEQSHSNAVLAQVGQDSTLSVEARVRQMNVQDTEALIDQMFVSESNATIEQSSGTMSSAAVIQQHGDNEMPGANLIASIYQSDGTDLSSAEIQQTNNNNTALIQQLNVASSEAFITQDGISGYAEIVQSDGHSNSAIVAQSGEGYSASIYQSGNNNDAYIAQM